eukprot:4829174-Pleurochrysis_carterae.AAC.1
MANLATRTRAHIRKHACARMCLSAGALTRTRTHTHTICTPAASTLVLSLTSRAVPHPSRATLPHSSRARMRLFAGDVHQESAPAAHVRHDALPRAQLEDFPVWALPGRRQLVGDPVPPPGDQGGGALSILLLRFAAVGVHAQGVLLLVDKVRLSRGDAPRTAHRQVLTLDETGLGDFGDAACLLQVADEHRREHLDGRGCTSAAELKARQERDGRGQVRR